MSRVTRSGLISDPRTWSGVLWREAISVALYIALALVGLAFVAVSVRNIEQMLVWGVLVLSVVAALALMRALR